MRLKIYLMLLGINCFISTSHAQSLSSADMVKIMMGGTPTDNAGVKEGDINILKITGVFTGKFMVGGFNTTVVVITLKNISGRPIKAFEGGSCTLNDYNETIVLADGHVSVTSRTPFEHSSTKSIGHVIMPDEEVYYISCDRPDFSSTFCDKLTAMDFVAQHGLEEGKIDTLVFKTARVAYDIPVDHTSEYLRIGRNVYITTKAADLDAQVDNSHAAGFPFTSSSKTKKEFFGRLISNGYTNTIEDLNAAAKLFDVVNVSSSDPEDTIFLISPSYTDASHPGGARIIFYANGHFDKVDDFDPNKKITNLPGRNPLILQ